MYIKGHICTNRGVRGDGGAHDEEELLGLGRPRGRDHRVRRRRRHLLVRIHFIIAMIRWAGLAPWEFEFHFPGSLTSTFLARSTRWTTRPSPSRARPSTSPSSAVVALFNCSVIRATVQLPVQLYSYFTVDVTYQCSCSVVCAAVQLPVQLYGYLYSFTVSQFHSRTV